MRSRIIKFIFIAFILIKCESTVIREKHTTDEETKISDIKPGEIPVKIAYEDESNSDRIKRDDASDENKTGKLIDTSLKDTLLPEDSTDIPQDKYIEKNLGKTTNPKILPDFNPSTLVDNILKVQESLMESANNLLTHATSQPKKLQKDLSLTDNGNLQKTLNSQVKEDVEGLKELKKILELIEAFIDIVRRECVKLIESMSSADLIQTASLSAKTLKEQFVTIWTDIENTFKQKIN